MSTPPDSFGQFVRQQRRLLDLTQAELARRVGCATITIRKIESNSLRPSVQIAERLAMSLSIPLEERADFVRLARSAGIETPSPPSLPTPPVALDEIGQEDLSGRAIRGYELGERVGEGGFGVVYRATQPMVDREVAIKIILPEYANHPSFIRRFEAEAQLIARLEHPFIVPLYDYWREPNVAYLVMRLLRGGSLKEKLKEGPLSPDVTLQMLAQIGQALDSAHRIGVVHRDIKPANILLDEGGNSYLADFGIAKNLGNPNVENKTAAGAIIGSHAYISPEQILSESIRPQTDVYCLGIMSYEMLTGAKPFRGPTPVEFVMQHMNEALPSLEEAGVSLPLAVDKVLARATTKKSEERYESVLTFVAELSQAFTKDASLMISPSAASERTADIEDADNPFRGLRAFTEADADNFFGRETLVQEMLGKLGEPSDLSRFLAVVGPSGSGKSSVVKAGLVPAVRRGGLPSSQNWFVVDMTPSSHPFEELEAALLRVAVNPPTSLLGQLRDGSRGILRAVRRVLPDDGQTELLLVVDQFEELFTLVGDEEEREAFIEGLVTAVLDPKSRLRVVVTLRADFTDRPLQFADLGELMRQRTLFVLPLSPDELEEAISRPINNLGMSLEPGLLATIVQEVAGEPGMLPLLQYGLTELFERRMGSRLTLAAYQEMGGVTGALAKRADEIYEQLDAVGQESARQLFLRLVTLGEGVEDTRRRVLQTELASLQATKKTSDQAANGKLSMVNSQLSIVNLFGKYRLLTFDHDPATRTPTVEVAHEALLREWPRLRGWLRESREDVRQQRLLTEAARLWEANGEDESYLLRGSRLTAFAAWQESTTAALTADEQTYLQASVAAREAREIVEAERRQRELETAQKLAETERERADIAAKREAESTQNLQKVRVFAAGLAVVLFFAIGAAWLAFSQFQQAQDNLLESERSRLALQAQNALSRGEGSTLTSLLALRSLELGYSPEANAALQASLLQGFSERTFVGHTDEVRWVAFSPDGRFIASASIDGTARLWNAQTGEELIQLIQSEFPLFELKFSPDGTMLITGDSNKVSRIWDVQSGEEIFQIRGETPSGVDFSSDSKRILAGGQNEVGIWDIASGRQLASFPVEFSELGWTARLSPDDQYITLAPLSSINDAAIEIREVDTGNIVQSIVGHVGWVSHVEFSPDSRFVLSTGQDGTARLWDVESGNEVRRFVGHTDALFNGFFSPDGQQIVTGSFDRTARVWDVSTGQELKRFSGHTEFINVAFSPSGQQIATGSGDSFIKLWDLTEEPEPRTLADFSQTHLQDYTDITISKNGRYVLIGRLSGNVMIVDTEGREATRLLNADNLPVTTLTLTEDNQYILVGNNQGLVQLFERATGDELWRFEEHEQFIRSAVFSNDNAFIITASQDGTSYLLETATGNPVQRLEIGQNLLTMATLSEDNETIAIGKSTGEVQLWEAESGELLTQYPLLHSGSVAALIFSEDGGQLFSAGEDTIINLIDVTRGEVIREFVGHTDDVTQLELSSSQQRLLSGSNDQTARLWNVATGEEIHQYSAHITQLFYAGFSPDDEQVFTADGLISYAWQTELEDVVRYACQQITRDFSEEERVLYNIGDSDPTCPDSPLQVTQAVATWTPIAPGSVAVGTTSFVTEIDFVPMEVANVQMAFPVQHVYISEDEDSVIRPFALNPTTLNETLYNSSEPVEDTVEEPFDLGPFPKGEPLGFTLAEWVSAEGHGTYTVMEDTAFLDFTFENLIPNGVYTLWCVEIQLMPTIAILQELPCGAPDGSENQVIVDGTGHADFHLEMEPLPLATDEIIYEIALGYHSDGQTYGPHPGEYGKNLHVQLIYDFLPPGQ